MPAIEKILIADDEPPARAKLKRFLAESLPHAEILEAGNGLEAIEPLETQSLDLLLLDIQMPGMTGLELIEAYGVEDLPPVIFTTAYDQYAVAAFEHNAVDYLLKPFDQHRFEKALQRLDARSPQEPQLTNDLVSKLSENLVSPQPLTRVMVREGSRLTPVNSADIRWLEADDKYVRLHLDSGKPLIRNTISNLEKRLDPEQFARVHRSTIVNLDCIQELQSLTHGDYQILLKNGDKITLSRRYAEAIKQRFL